LEFFIEPIQEIDKVRGRICDMLIFYRNIYLNANPVVGEDEVREVSKKLRELATILMAKKHDTKI